MGLWHCPLFVGRDRDGPRPFYSGTAVSHDYFLTLSLLHSALGNEWAPEMNETVRSESLRLPRG